MFWHTTLDEFEQNYVLIKRVGTTVPYDSIRLLFVKIFQRFKFRWTFLLRLLQSKNETYPGANRLSGRKQIKYYVHYNDKFRKQNNYLFSAVWLILQHFFFFFLLFKFVCKPYQKCVFLLFFRSTSYCR